MVDMSGFKLLHMWVLITLRTDPAHGEEGGRVWARAYISVVPMECNYACDQLQYHAYTTGEKSFP